MKRNYITLFFIHHAMVFSSGVLFGLLAMLSYGIADGVGVVSAKEVGVRKTIVYRGIVVTILLLFVFLFSNESLLFSPSYLLMMTMIGILGYIALHLFLKALTIGKLGIITPITSTSLAYTVFFSLLFFHESLSLLQSVAIFLILLGVVFISLDFNAIRSSSLFSLSSGVPYALLCALIWGFLFFIVKIPVQQGGPILTALLLEGGIMVVSVALVFWKKEQKMMGSFSKRDMKYLLVLGFLIALGTLAYTYGITTAQVSVVSAITFSSPLIAVLYGAMIFHERLKVQQYGAIVLLLLGIVCLAI